MTSKYVVGRIERLGPEVVLSPVPNPGVRTKVPKEKKVSRLIDAARLYRDERSQVALDALLAAAKDID